MESISLKDPKTLDLGEDIKLKSLEMNIDDLIADHKAD